MKILVTGASGFIGKYLVKELVKQHKVDCLVRKTSNVDGLEKCKLVYGDVTDLASLKNVVKNYDVIFHLVGIGGLSAVSDKEYKKFMRVNSEGTKNLLEACKGKKIGKIIVFSSTAAMGVFNGVKNEESKCDPESVYQKSKYEQERVAKGYNLPVIILRPSMVCGYGDKSELMTICKFIKRGFVPIFGSGRNNIPLVHVKDVVNASLVIMEKGEVGKTYIVTNKNGVSLEILIKKLSKIMNKKVMIVKIPKFIAKFFAFFIEYFFKVIGKHPFVTAKRIDSISSNRNFDISALEKLGYKQKISLDECLRDCVRGY